MRATIAVLMLSAIGFASDFQSAKISDVRGYEVSNTPLLAPNNGHPVMIDQGTRQYFTLTLDLAGMRYSGNFKAGRHLKPSDFVVGDTVDAAINGDNLVIRTSAGKEEKTKVVRRERIPQ